MKKIILELTLLVAAIALFTVESIMLIKVDSELVVFREAKQDCERTLKENKECVIIVKVREK